MTRGLAFACMVLALAWPVDATANWSVPLTDADGLTFGAWNSNGTLTVAGQSILLLDPDGHRLVASWAATDANHTETDWRSAWLDQPNHRTGPSSVLVAKVCDGAYQECVKSGTTVLLDLDADALHALPIPGCVHEYAARDDRAVVTVAWSGGFDHCGYWLDDIRPEFLTQFNTTTGQVIWTHAVVQRDVLSGLATNDRANMHYDGGDLVFVQGAERDAVIIAADGTARYASFSLWPGTFHWDERQRVLYASESDTFGRWTLQVYDAGMNYITTLPAEPSGTFVLATTADGRQVLAQDADGIVVLDVPLWGPPVGWPDDVPPPPQPPPGVRHYPAQPDLIRAFGGGASANVLLLFQYATPGNPASQTRDMRWWNTTTWTESARTDGLGLVAVDADHMRVAVASGGDYLEILDRTFERPAAPATTSRFDCHDSYALEPGQPYRLPLASNGTHLVLSGDVHALDEWESWDRDMSTLRLVRRWLIEADYSIVPAPTVDGLEQPVQQLVVQSFMADGATQEHRCTLAWPEVHADTQPTPGSPLGPTFAVVLATAAIALRGSRTTGRAR